MNLEELGQLVGKWELEMSHPSLPGVIVRGSAEIDWLEGNRFLIHRARTEHPDFPDAISIIGDMASDRVDGDTAAEPRWRMHYFDSRGVFRIYEVDIQQAVWKIWRDAPAFSQRFTGAVGHEGKTIVGFWELSSDGQTWQRDLEISYRRLS